MEVVVFLNLQLRLEAEPGTADSGTNNSTLLELGGGPRQGGEDEQTLPSP